MVNRYEHLGADPRGGFEKRIERVDHAAVKRVLDRHETVINVAADDFLENRVDVRKWDVVDTGAEFEDGGLVRERAERTEEADAERGRAT